MVSQVEDALPNGKLSLLLHQNIGPETGFCGGHVFALKLPAVPMNSPLPSLPSIHFSPSHLGIHQDVSSTSSISNGTHGANGYRLRYQ